MVSWDCCKCTGDSADDGKSDEGAPGDRSTASGFALTRTCGRAVRERERVQSVKSKGIMLELLLLLQRCSCACEKERERDCFDRSKLRAMRSVQGREM